MAEVPTSNEQVHVDVPQEEREEVTDMPKEERKEVMDKALSWPMVALCFLGVLVCLHIFLIGLSLMGSSFKVLGGKGASSLFSSTDNPVAGLMTGILATVFVQSSSTSTSIVVALAASGQITVKNGIPIIMGANIGTSVTNTIVSMGQSGDRIDLERAFAGATVHDMFNMLTVATLLPIEVIFGAMKGEGGPLYWLTYAITEGLMGGHESSGLPESPIQAATAPFSDGILKANKYVIYAMTLGEPTALIAKEPNTTLCCESRRLGPIDSAAGDGLEVNCSKYYCIDSTMDENFEKLSSSSYKHMKKCGGMINDKDGKLCGKEKCYLDAGAYYQKNVAEGRLIKGGFVKGAGDIPGGIIGLIFSLLLLCGGLIGLCTVLKKMFLSKAKTAIRNATKVNDYLAIAVGMAITMVVQSSSVVTSALTPLCGLGVLPLNKMLPLTLGSNIGTTCTALIASLVSLKFDAVQIALCHLFFNIFGILIWFPIPPMRRIPLGAAKLLGLYASFYRFVPGLYILIAFVIVPGICLGISAVFNASIEAGVVLLLLILGVLGGFEFWWWVGYPIQKGAGGFENAGCYKALSKEQRREGEMALEAANAALRGVDVAVA